MPAATGLAFVNDVDLATLGFDVEEVKNLGDGPEAADNFIVRGDGASEWDGDVAQLAVRKPSIIGNLNGTTRDALEASLDLLRNHCYQGPVRLRFANRPTRFFRDARCHQVIVPSSKPGQLTGLAAAGVEIAWDLDDPFLYACLADGTPDMTRLALVTGTRTPLPMGTAGADLAITVHGGSADITNFTVLLRDKNGLPVFSMAFVGTVPAGTRVLIQSETSQIQTIDAGGVVTDAYALWDRTVTDETNDFPVLDPIDASYYYNVWATLELVAGSSGTPVGLVEYLPAYL